MAIIAPPLGAAATSEGFGYSRFSGHRARDKIVVKRQHQFAAS
jgi:hypothetical protein